MLGRTNLLFVAGDNTSELAFTPDYILTSASGNILKMEYINNLFFLFASDEVVLYGSDINSLQTLKNGNEVFKAKHIIYADGVYYMTKIDSTAGKAIIYKTADLISFEEITLKTGTSSYDYSVHGLFLNSKSEIVVLIEEDTNTSASNYQKYLLVTDTLTNYQEENAVFIKTDSASYIYNKKAIGTKLKKDRIFTTINGGYSSSSSIIITLDGTISTVDMYSFFAVDYFFKNTTSGNTSKLYYSLNGLDYINLDFSNSVTDFVAINVFEYDGVIALIYNCTENEETVTKLTTAATPKELIKATASAIPVTIDYSMNADSNVFVDEYVYIGSTGGIAIKGKIDNAETERPDVVVVKGMAAKEALKQANDYTDEKYKTITAEVELHEETTRQYMEEAFKATPEGYEELFDTVSENKVKIDTIIEKADLSIKADASGEEIHLTDSADGKAVEFALFGKARQNTTLGNQLLNYEEWKKSTVMNGNGVFENNGVTLTATSQDCYTDQTAFPELARINVNEGDIVTLSWEESTNKQASIYLFPNGSTTNLVRVYNHETKSLTYTVPSGVTFITFRFGVLNSGETISYKNIMVNKGANALPFEPYTNGASPNPSYPQEIEVSGASGSVEVKSCGKNLLKNNAVTTTNNGITFTVNEKDGTVTANGTATGTALLFLVGTNTIASEHCFQNMILSGCPNGGSSGGYVLRVQTFTDSSLSSEVGLQDDIGNGAIIPNTTHARIYIRIAKGVTVNNLVFKPMISLESGEYQPYKETLSTIPTENGLAGIKVSSGGNYTDQNGQQWICDEVVKYADGSGAFVQRIKHILVDGTNKLFTSKSSSKNNIIYSFPASDIKKVISDIDLANIISTRFSVINASAGYTKSLIGIYVNKDYTIIYCAFGLESNLTSIELANAWLINNPFEVYYELAEPIETPLTAEELAEISTFYPVTNISNDFDCGMSMKYNADSKNYIDRMVAEQVASIVANMNK